MAIESNTVTLVVSFRIPIFTVITAVPFLTPVTVPYFDTLAIELLLEDQEGVLFEPIISNLSVLPAFKVIEVLLIDQGSYTLTLHFSIFPLTEAEIVVVPSDLPVTIPMELTTATALLADVQVIFLEVPEMDICLVVFTGILISLWLILMVAASATVEVTSIVLLVNKVRTSKNATVRM